jgi:glycosyltransferase involved in cell wall biosynthesis
MNFSIILPFYGSLGELKRTLKSISSQTISDYELILIDDNKIKSYDSVFLNNLIKSFNILNAKIFVNILNMGANYSRNLGIINSNFEYVSFIDCGDTWSSNKLFKESKIIKKNPDLIYSKQRFVHRYFSIIHNKDHYPNYLKSQMIKSICTSTSITVKKEIILNIGLFNINLKSSQDSDLLLRLLNKTNNIKFINSILSSKIVDKKNSISSNVNYLDNTFIHVRLPYFKLFDRNLKSAVFFSFFSSRLLRNFKNISLSKELRNVLKYKPMTFKPYLLLIVKLIYYFFLNLITKNK